MTASARTSPHRALLGERIARQGLTRPAARTPVEAVRRTTAVQAQDNLASRLGVRARSAGLTDADVRQATDEQRSLVRTWLMRGTIHLVATDDLRWLLALFAPALTRRFRTRWTQLALTPAVLEAHAAALAEMLKAGPMTRAQIRAALPDWGVHVGTGPEVNSHPLLYASCLGLICRGADRGSEATFVLLDERVPHAPAGPTGDEALAELARRYFAAYSPATPADFTAWAGLPSGRAVQLIRDELTPVEVDGRPGFRLGEMAPQGGVRLLPGWDNYLIGYRDRGALLHPDRHPRVYQAGVIRPVVLVDGCVAGAWRYDRARGEVRLEPFDSWPPATQRAVAAEVADLGRFLDREVRAVGEP
jgi:hypothetical protein